MELFEIYLLLVNLAAFAMMGMDKFRARRGLWRIPERTLLLTALVGGSLGAFLGMRLFRHKTRHRAFSIGIPGMLLLHALLWLL